MASASPRCRYRVSSSTMGPVPLRATRTRRWWPSRVTRNAWPSGPSGETRAVHGVAEAHLDVGPRGAGADLVLAVGAAASIGAYALMLRIGRLPEEERVLR